MMAKMQKNRIIFIMTMGLKYGAASLENAN